MIGNGRVPLSDPNLDIPIGIVHFLLQSIVLLDESGVFSPQTLDQPVHLLTFLLGPLALLVNGLKSENNESPTGFTSPPDSRWHS